MSTSLLFEQLITRNKTSSPSNLRDSTFLVCTDQNGCSHFLDQNVCVLSARMKRFVGIVLLCTLNTYARIQKKSFRGGPTLPSFF